MKKILNALFLTIVTFVTFSACSDVPSPYDTPGSGNGEVPGVSGEGTKENPYDVAAAMVKQDGSVAWVQGYIVGSINNIYDDKGEFAGNDPVFAAPFNVNTNILIAASATEKDYNKCLPVKLKAAELRSALNVMDNASVLGKAVIIEGKLAAGFGRSALIETTAAVLDGKDVGDSGEIEGAYINETFATSLGGFKSVSASGSLSWVNDFSSAMVKGGSATEKFPSETWLVAPTIDLSTETEAYATFNHAINYADAATIKEYHQLVISKDYVSDVKTATWTTLPIAMASGNSFTFVNTGNITIPAEFLGQSKVTVALKYTSTATTGSTWEVQKFIVVHGKGTSVDPEPPVTDGGTKEDPYTVTEAVALSSKTGTQVAWVKGYIVGGVNSDATSASIDGPEDIIFGASGIRNSAIVLAASIDETDYKKCIVIGFGSDSGAAKTALNLVDNPGNLGKEVILYGTLKDAFSAPGMKTITDFVLGAGGGEEPKPESRIIFEEAFGSIDVVKEKFQVAKYTGWDNKEFVFTDEYGTWADIRTSGTMINAVWFPASTATVDKSASLKIAGFNTTGYTNLKLSYSIATQTKDKDQNIIKVKCGDKTMDVPSKALDKYNEYYSIELTDVPAGITTIEFISDAANTIGFRIDNVKLTGDK